MKSVCVALFVSVVAYAFGQPASAADAKAKEKVLYSFSGGTGGANPEAGLIDVKGTLYGTAAAPVDYGAVFALDPKTGAEKTLFSFQDGVDGGGPTDSLIAIKSMLYGTTSAGGNTACNSGYGCGVVFALDRNTGAETVLYTFCSQQNCTDGEFPWAGLIDVDGTLYGTTVGGGANGGGTVFALDVKTGTEKTVYSFCSQQGCEDGDEPYAAPLDVNGTLYGTTSYGGASNYGTVFALDTATGVETVIYSFRGGTDGAYPKASLINKNGTLYGTTFYGGASNDGAVFALDLKTGAETILYSFCSQKNCIDGQYSYGSLIDVKGMLYGTTYAGGSGTTSWCTGCGAVFSLDPKTGAEKVLYSFCSQQNCTDGAVPFAGVIDEKGTLYGTTQQGGSNGVGTVFALKP